MAGSRLHAGRRLPTPDAVDGRLDELFRLEPRLLELQREVDAVVDDGKSSWFCSNYVWLPVNTRLRLLIGVARVTPAGEALQPELFDSRAYERVFTFLSQRLPPCRGCGCQRFQTLREESA